MRRESLSPRLSRVYLPDRNPPASGLQTMTPKALILDHRHDLALEFASGDRVIGLHGLEARVAALIGDAKRLHDLPGGVVRAADRPHEAAAHAIVERPQRLFERRDGVEAVDLVEIDMIEARAASDWRRLIHDMSAREADGVRSWSHARRAPWWR